MKSHAELLGLAILLAAVQLATGQGTVIVQHSGYNDPTSEGFGFGGTGQVGPVTNDFGMNAWSTTVSYSSVGYSDSFPSMAGSTWELTGILRFVTPGTANGTFNLGIETGAEEFLLDFGSRANGDPTVAVVGSLSPLLVLNGAGSTYNTYQLLYDAPSDTASLWVNGVEQIEGIHGLTYSVPPLPPTSQFFWGGGNQDSPETANWNLVSFQIAPEPTVLSLVFLGGGALFFVRRKLSPLKQRQTR